MSTFRFKISDHLGDTTFYSNKVKNWDEIEQALTRSKTYRGRVREVSNSFIFVKDIRTRVINNFDINGINAEMYLLVEKGNDNKESFSYKAVGNPYYMKADFNSINIDELGVEITFVDTEFNQRISDGEKDSMDFTMTETVFGDTIETSYVDLLKTINMPDSKLIFNSLVNGDGGSYVSIGDSSSYPWINGYLILGGTLYCNVQYNSDENIKTVTGRTIHTPEDRVIEDYFYLLAETSRVININYDYEIWTSRSDASTFNALIYINRHSGIKDEDTGDWSLGELVETIYIYDYPLNNIDSQTPLSVSGTLNIDINEGDSLILLSYSPSSIFLAKSELLITSNEKYDATTSNCILPHELFTRYIYLMTGVNDAFYSEYFGRTELGYDEDGEGAYLAVMDGYMIRNMPIDEYPFNAKFNDIIIDFIKLKNLVAYVEYINDSQVLRIEKYSDIIGTEVIVDLGELVSEVKRKVNEDLTCSSIIVGYEDQEPEELNGLNIFNGEANYSVPLNGVDNELDLKLKSITASQIIEFTRRKPYTDYPDTDTSYDKKMFIVDAKAATVSAFDIQAKQGEDFQLIENVENGELAYNLNLSPRRILKEWENVVSSCTQNISSDLIHTKGAATADMVTQLNTEIEPLYENSNIDPSTLTTPLFVNETLEIGDAVVSDEQNELINENPNKIVKFTNKGISFYGMPNKYNFQAPYNKANFDLIRSNR